MAKTPLAPSVTWLSDEVQPSVLLAAMLTGRADETADVVADALARKPSWWSGSALAGDVTVRLRRAIVERVLARRAALDGAGDELAKLDPLALVVVVLRDGEHLPVAEIFATIDRPNRRIREALADYPVGAYDNELAERRAAAPDVGEVLGRYSTAARDLKVAAGRRRRRLAALTGVVAAGLVAAVVGPSLVVRVFPPDVRSAGQWRFSHVVDDVEGWGVAGRHVTPVVESTTLIEEVTIEACDVTVGPSDLTPEPGEAQRTVRVRGFRGTLITGLDAGPRVVWRFAPGGHVAVSCGSQVSEESVLRIARAVRFEDSRILLPVTLSAIPSGYEISSVSESIADEWTMASLVLDPLDEGAKPPVGVRYTNAADQDLFCEQPNRPY